MYVCMYVYGHHLLVHTLRKTIYFAVIDHKMSKWLCLSLLFHTKMGLPTKYMLCLYYRIHAYIFKNVIMVFIK